MPCIYRFQDCELDPAQSSLRRGGEVVPLEPRAFEVLLHLLRHRERVVSKQELLETLWPGTFVSESVLPTQVAILRKTLGDSRAEQRLIQTLYRRGYRFVGEVTELPGAGTSPAPAAVLADTPRWTSGILPFVGRSSPLQLLRDASIAARGGERRIIAVTGEAGIGKSRLAEVWLEEARAAGMQVAIARADREIGEPAFDVFRQLLRELVHKPGGAGEALLAGDRPHLAPLLGEPRQSGPVDLAPAERARSRLFAAAARVFGRACVDGPLAVVLEDVQDMDAPSWLLLRFLVRELADARLVILATCRVPGAESPLAADLAALSRIPGFGRVELQALGPGEVAAVVGAIPGLDEHSGLAATLHELTEGHPLFLGEIVRWIASDPGILGRFPLRLPDGLREAIGLRLAAVSLECRAVLSRAAVVGREFDLALLSDGKGASGAGLLDILDEAVSARLIEPAPVGLSRMRFAHALFREALYADLPLADRVREHQRLADVLAPRLRGDSDPKLLECAHHAQLGATGRNPEWTLELMRRAGRHCIRATAYEEGAAWLERGHEVLDTSAEATAELRCELLIELGDAYSREAKRAETRSAYLEAANLAREVQRADLFGHAAVGYGMRSEWGGPRDDSLVALLEEALERLGDEHPAIRALVWARLAGTEAYWSKPDRCREAAGEALRLAETSGDVEALVAAKRSVCFARESIHVPIEETIAGAQDLRAFGERLIASGHELLGKDVLMSAHQAFYNAHMISGDAGAATPYLEKLEALTEDLHEPLDRWILSWHHFGRAVCGARFEDADRLLSEGRALAIQIGVPDAAGLPDLMDFHLRIERGGASLRALGDPVVTLDRLARAADGIPEFGWPIRTLRLVCAFEMGMEAEARAQLDTLATHRFEDLPRDSFWILCCALLSWGSAGLGDRARAATLREMLRPYANRTALGSALRIVLGPTCYFLACLDQVLGERDEARAGFEDAIERSRRLGARTCELRARVGLASLDVEGGGAARKRGRIRLDELNEEAQTLGMQGLADRCAVLRGR